MGDDTESFVHVDVNSSSSSILQELVVDINEPLSNVFYEPQYNHYRRAKIILFTDAFNLHDKFRAMPKEEKTKLLRALERCCNNYTIEKAHVNNIMTSWQLDKFVDLYHDICYKVSANMNDTPLVTGAQLAKKILDGEIDVQDVCKMTSQDICPDKYSSIIDRLESSKNVVQTRNTSSLYTCGTCKKSQCWIENRYNRSLDEGVNLTITCMNCGKQWNA
jgi:DNA-directed RNA polymerase subunit M/transcription elongation factor TFIIS